MSELQDAVTLAQELHQTSVSKAIIETSVSVALVAVQDAKAAFDKARGTGSKAEYLRASDDLTRAIAHLEDQERQAGIRP